MPLGHSHLELPPRKGLEKSWEGSDGAFSELVLLTSPPPAELPAKTQTQTVLRNGFYLFFARFSVCATLVCKLFSNAALLSTSVRLRYVHLKRNKDRPERRIAGTKRVPGTAALCTCWS